MTRLLAIAIILSATTAFAEETAQELVTKAVARSRAIKSGRFTFTYLKRSPRHSTDPPNLPQTHKLRFAGTSRCHYDQNWANATYDVVQLHYAAAARQVLIEQNPHGERRSLVTRLPYSAGSFREKVHVDWVESHASEFKTVGTERIDDVETAICEAYTKPAESGPGRSYVDLVGRVRLHIAPSLGYVMPVYEFYTDADKLICRWSASSFKECSAGVFLAEIVEEELCHSGDLELDPNDCWSTLITVAADKVNEALTEMDLAFTVSAGVTVIDKIVDVTYKTRDDISSRDIARLGKKAASLKVEELKQPVGLDDPVGGGR